MWSAASVWFALFASAPSAWPCPFCTTLEPTLASRRESAALVVVGEILEQRGKTAIVRVHRVLVGADHLARHESLSIPASADMKPGSLALLFGDKRAADGASDWEFSSLPVNEASLAYFAQSPALRAEPKQRLPYFVRFLEHPDPLVAEDAYLEFGHASYDDVRSVAELLPMPRLRNWLADARVSPAHKGFYGLALALAQNADERRDNAEFLRKLILQPADDFRAGFDGVLGGYLMLTGEQGLALVEQRYLADPRAADGDVRHALTALRFYREFGRAIPPERLAQALRQLLARPEFAEPVILELSRLQDWSSADQIAGLYFNEPYAKPAIRRAIVGYLSACPLASAAGLLKRLRLLDPDGVSAAQRGSSKPGDSRQ